MIYYKCRNKDCEYIYNPESIRTDRPKPEIYVSKEVDLEYIRCPYCRAIMSTYDNQTDKMLNDGVFIGGKLNDVSYNINEHGTLEPTTERHGR